MHLADLETNNFSSLPFHPPPSYARMYTAEQGTQVVAGASRSLARLSVRRSVRPSHPVIPRCLLGFSWLRIVLVVQCFPTSTKLSQNSLSTAKVSVSLLREIANEKWRLHRNAHFKFRAGGRGVQRTFSPVPELPALMHPPCISA